MEELNYDSLSDRSKESLSFKNDSSESDAEENEDNYLARKNYNFCSFENIICIELMNNSKIYINYKNTWKIKDVYFY